MHFAVNNTLVISNNCMLAVSELWNILYMSYPFKFKNTLMSQVSKHFPIDKCWQRIFYHVKKYTQTT